MSFAKVETPPGDGDWGWDVNGKGKESRSRHSAFEPLWSQPMEAEAESAHLKSGDKEHRDSSAKTE